MILIYIAGIIGVLGGLSSAACPDADPTLGSFAAAFPSLTKSSTPDVTTSLLLDTDLDVTTLTISGNGKLVFKQQDLVIKTKGILIKDNGKLIIGSETCRFTNKVDILLEGEVRETDRSKLTGAGEKYIAVQDKGTLEIWGEDKLSYTKLDETIKRFDDSSNSADVTFHHKNSPNSGTTTGNQGLAMYVFDSSLAQKSYKVYDVTKSTASSEQKQVDALSAALDNDVADGDMVMLAVQNYFKSKAGTDYTALFTKIETLAGMSANELYLRTSNTNEYHYDAWAMVFVKIASGGTPNFNQSYDEQIGKLDTHALASIGISGKKASAYSTIYRGSTSKSWVDFRILNVTLGNPTLTVIDDVVAGSWSVGDKVLVTTTDYAAHHGEVRTITSITGKTITLNHELSYNHFGAIEDGIDMRAEVALLSRSIKIHGEIFRNCPASHEIQCGKTNFYTYGAHIKIINDFAAVHLQGFELYHAGQATDKGFYPIHFHMCGDVNNRKAMVKQVSIHHTFSRAVTVHGTLSKGAENDANNKGVQLIDNVAFNIFGHAYFLEDGAEPGTYIINNLAAYIRNIKNSFNFVTDVSKATAFWITNPKVQLINNAVAGSEGFGYWYTFPLEPVGPGKALNVFQKLEARNTPLWTFDNNVAHSCKRGGFNFDNILTSDNGAIGGCMNYKSVADPLDPNSEPVKNIIRMTAYKNLLINIWARGGYFDFVGCSTGHSRRAYQFARGSNQQMFLRMSSVRGTGGDNAEPADYPDAPSLSDFPHSLGFVFYDGPSYASDSFFTGFEDTDISAGAFGFNPKNKFTSSVASSIKGVIFGADDTVLGSFNRVFDGSISDTVNGFANFNGDESATTRDYDGSVTKCPSDSSWSGPKQIVKPELFVVTPSCEYRHNWQMAICDNLYGKFGVNIKAPSVFNAAAEMRRTQISGGSEAFEDHTGDHTTQFMVMLDNYNQGYKYDLQFEQEFPTKVVFEAKAVERDYPMIVGICLPVGVTRSDFTLSAKKADSTFWGNNDDFKEVTSIAGLDDSGRTIYIDVANRMLYYKYVSGVRRIPEWDAHDTDHCPGGWCPSLTLTLTKTGVVYDSTTKCFNPTPAQLNTDFDISGLSNHTCKLPAGTRPNNWGRGDTRSDVDGGWGPWGKWEDKCYTDVNNKPSCSRNRVCDSPPKFGGGADCSGNSKETAECQKPCPVDGVWGQWSLWGNCVCSGTTSMGTRTRTRTCNGPFHFGAPCVGADEEENKCQGYCNIA